MASAEDRRPWPVGVAILAAIAALIIFVAGRSDGDPAAARGASTSQTAAPTSERNAGGSRARAAEPSMIHASTIGGSVKSDAGAPIVDAEVCAWRPIAGAPPSCTRSAADGRYQLVGVPSVVIVSASAKGFAPSQQPAGSEHGRVVLVGGDDRVGIDFQLSTGGVPLLGVVNDVFGGPIEGATITATMDGDSRSGQTIDPRVQRLHAVSDADGRFELAASRGGWVVSTHAPGYADARTATTAPGPTLAIAMMPEATIAGVVVETGSDRVVPGARIVLRTWHGGSPSDRTTGYADDDGHFRITSLSPGRYRPGAMLGTRFGTSDRSFAIDLGESITDVRIEVSAGAAIAGKVLVEPGDAPCPAGDVHLIDAATSEQRFASIALDGTVELDGILPGSYDVSVSCTDHSSANTARRLEVAPGDNEVTWMVERGLVVRGKLLDAAGKGHAGHVAAVSTTGHGDGLMHTTLADDAGDFEIVGVATGLHSLSATLGDGARVSKTIDVSATLGEVELRLPEIGSLHGKVTRAANPVAHAQVYARPLDRDRAFGGLARADTDDDGRYAFDDLQPGRYAVRVVDATEAELATAEVEVGTQAATLDLEAAAIAELIGVVVDGAGAPVPDAMVSAMISTALSSVDDRASVLRSATQSVPVVTDADGGFTIPSVDADSRFTVLAQRRGGGQAIADNVRPGRRVTLRLAGLGDVVGTVESAVAITGLSVAVHKTGGHSAIRESFSVGTGTFAFSRVPSGTYDVVAVARQGRARGRVEVTAAGTARVRLVLEPNRTFRGRFVDPRTDTPIPDVYAVVTDEDGDVQELAGKAERIIATQPDGIKSDAAGVFTLRDVPSRTARMFAFGADFGEGLPDILEFMVVPAGAETPEIVDIPLVRKPAGAIAGDAYGLGLDVPMFCVDTPRIDAIDDATRGAGLRKGDEIVAIDGHDTSGFRCYLARGLLMAAAGQSVTLTLARGEVVRMVARAPTP